MTYNAGDARKAPIYRPIELTKIKDEVHSFNDVANALRHCAIMCTKLAYQRDLVKNTYCIRVALIQHLFTRVIPLPLPINHPRRSQQCFWHAKSREMRYETQTDILRLLNVVSQHFSCAALSLHVSRSFDAARILTMACVATVADAVMRKTACDIPSQLSLHYSGDVDGPTYPFGVEMRQFATESVLFLLPDPALVVVRTQVYRGIHIAGYTHAIALVFMYVNYVWFKIGKLGYYELHQHTFHIKIVNEGLKYICDQKLLNKLHQILLRYWIILFTNKKCYGRTTFCSVGNEQ